VFVIFLQKEIIKKVLLKLLVKLTTVNRLYTYKQNVIICTLRVKTSIGIWEGLQSKVIYWDQQIVFVITEFSLFGQNINTYLGILFSLSLNQKFYPFRFFVILFFVSFTTFSILDRASKFGASENKRVKVNQRNC